MTNRKYWGMIFILPGFLGLLLFYVIPFGMSIYYTFTKGVANLQFAGLENFVSLLSSPTFVLAAKNTFLFIGIGVPMLISLALYISLIMSAKTYAMAKWFMLTPMIIPVASAMLGWGIIFGENGPINALLELVGAGAVDFWADAWSKFSFLSIFVIKNLGYMIIIFTGAMAGIPKEYREIFIMDSKSNFKYGVRVVIPTISPVIFFGIILSTVNSFQIFRESYIRYGSIPPQEMYMLQNFMNNNFFKLNYQRLSTAAFIVVVLISVAVALFLKMQSKD